MATKPDEMIKWCEDNPAGRIQPPLASEQGGYPKNAVPPFQWMNWKFWNISRWIAWLEEQVTSARIEEYEGMVHLSTEDGSDNEYEVLWSRATTIAGMTRIDAKIQLKSGGTALDVVTVGASSYALFLHTEKEISVQLTATGDNTRLVNSTALTASSFYPEQGTDLTVIALGSSGRKPINGFYVTFYGKRQVP